MEAPRALPVLAPAVAGVAESLVFSPSVVAAGLAPNKLDAAVVAGAAAPEVVVAAVVAAG